MKMFPHTTSTYVRSPLLTNITEYLPVPEQKLNRSLPLETQFSGVFWGFSHKKPLRGLKGGIKNLETAQPKLNTTYSESMCIEMSTTFVCLAESMNACVLIFASNLLVANTFAYTESVIGNCSIISTTRNTKGYSLTHCILNFFQACAGTRHKNVL